MVALRSKLIVTVLLVALLVPGMVPAVACASVGDWVWYPETNERAYYFATPSELGTTWTTPTVTPNVGIGPDQFLTTEDTAGVMVTLHFPGGNQNSWGYTTSWTPAAGSYDKNTLQTGSYDWKSQLSGATSLTVTGQCFIGVTRSFLYCGPSSGNVWPVLGGGNNAGARITGDYVTTAEKYIANGSTHTFAMSPAARPAPTSIPTGEQHGSTVLGATSILGFKKLAAGGFQYFTMAWGSVAISSTFGIAADGFASSVGTATTTANWLERATCPQSWRKLLYTDQSSQTWTLGPVIGGWGSVGAGVSNDTELYALLYRDALAGSTGWGGTMPSEPETETPEEPYQVSLPATPSILPSDTGLPSEINTGNLPAWFDPYWSKIMGWLGNVSDMFWFVSFFSNDPSDAGW